MTNDDEKYASKRLLLQRFENVNKQVFKGVLTGVTKPTIEEHTTHIGKPNTWGTHVELFATASYCQMPKVYSYPVTVEDAESFVAPSHFELLYYSNSHYYTTEKPSTTAPQLQPLSDNSFITVLNHIIVYIVLLCVSQ